MEEVQLKERMSEKCYIPFAKLQTKQQKGMHEKTKKRVSLTRLLTHRHRSTHLTTQRDYLASWKSEINYPFALLC